jgi:predicted phage terminase large subunit-like protein
VNRPPHDTSSTANQMMRLHLMTFIHRCFVELNPTVTMSQAPHLRVLAAKLADTLLGRGPKRLIINLPPRSLKSISVSVAFVAWLLGIDPTKQIICASYGQDLADKHARDTRTIMMSAFYQNLFPGTRLSPQRMAVNDFATTKNGFRMATSVGGVLTGRGGDVLILDDPLKPDEALSAPRRAAVIEWYQNSALSRLNSKEEGIVIIVMQRLHQDDLVGHVLENDENWEVLSFPAIAEEPQEFTGTTVLGPFTFKREVGDVLDPARESLATLRQVEADIGSYNFASQYQQNPTPKGGAMIKREWLQQRYDPNAPLPPFSTKLQSWDTANKSGELNDFSVCTTWGVFEGKYYLLHVYREKLIYPDLKRMVIQLKNQYAPHKVLIEDKASGTQLIQDLRREGHLQVTPYEAPPQMDKILRLHSRSALIEAGKLILPASAPWLVEYERELMGFPGAKFDDQVDSTVQALDYMSKYSSVDAFAQMGRILTRGGR